MDTLAEVAAAAAEQQQQQQQGTRNQPNDNYNNGEEEEEDSSSSDGSSSSRGSGDSDDNEQEEDELPSFRTASESTQEELAAQVRIPTEEATPTAEVTPLSSSSSHKIPTTEAEGGEATEAIVHGGPKPKKRKRGRKPKDPNAPRKPQPAYAYFMADMRSKTQDMILKDNPELQDQKQTLFISVSTKLAQIWRELGDTDREKYEEMARKDKRRYEAELATYKPSPWMDKEGNIHDPLAPKKPQSAYFFFCHEKRRQVKEESNENGPYMLQGKASIQLSMTDVTKELSRQWKALPEKDKEKYYELAMEDKQRYQQEMENYRAPAADDKPEWIAIQKKVKAKRPESRKRKRSATPTSVNKQLAGTPVVSNEVTEKETEAQKEMTEAQKAALDYMKKREKLLKGYQKHLEHLFLDPWKKKYSPSALLFFAERMKSKVAPSSGPEPLRWLVESQESIVNHGKSTLRTKVKNMWDKEINESARYDYKHVTSTLRQDYPQETKLLNQYEKAWEQFSKSFNAMNPESSELRTQVKKLYDAKYPVPEEVKSALHPASQYRLDV